MVSVYLSNQNIVILDGGASGGHVTLKAQYLLRDTEGCVINGIVTDADAFVRIVGAFWKEKSLPRKNVRLVLGSSQLATRLVTMPALRPKGALQFLSEEFGDVERAADPLFSSTLLDQDRRTKLCRVLAVQADRGFIQSYLRLFASFGVEIASVLSSLDCAVRLLQEAAECRQRTCLVQIMEENYMTVLVFVEGAYVYSSRKRMFNEPGTADYCAEAAQAVSNLEQFLRANYKEHPLQSVYLYGFGAADFDRCRTEIMAAVPDREVAPLPADGLIRSPADRAETDGGVLFPAGGLLRAERKLTFLDRRAARGASSGPLRSALPAAALLAVLLALFAVLSLIELHGRHRLKELNRQLDVMDAQRSDADYGDMSVRAENERLLADGLQTAWDDLSSYPLVNDRVDRALQTCAAGDAEVRITGYDSATGVLLLDATVKDMEKVHPFIARLRQENLFAEVDYNGYSYQEQPGNWRVDVSCRLNASAGRTEAGK